MKSSSEPSPTETSQDAQRDTILITHANPEDNGITSWLASRLTLAGYRVWVDLNELRGGADFWKEIDFQLRTRTIKQIVLISKYIGKPGVQKELAIGDIVGKQIGDPAFMIPVRVSNVPFSEFPPELVRRNAHNAYPNWADALSPLLKDLEDAQVPRIPSPDYELINQLVRARENGRNFVKQTPETLLSNWFEVCARPELHLFSLQCPDSQKKRWLRSLEVPYVEYGNLIASFCDPVSFRASGTFPVSIDRRFSLAFDELMTGREVMPFRSRSDARRTIVNLMRQHWNYAMSRKGLKPFEYADGKTGWFFPDGLIDGSVKLEFASGTRVNRVLSGKFKERRWHLCLVAKPLLFPLPMFRVHANVTLSEDGVCPLPGKKTQRIRKRLTKSWWNDKWRDMLLASTGWLAGGETALIDISAGAEAFQVSSFPLAAESAVSYVDESNQVSEESEDGEIELSEEVDGEPMDEAQS